LGLDRLYVVHRTVGIAALTMLVLHGLLYTTFELALGFLSLNLNKLLGITGLLLIIVVAVVALAWRAFHFSYETWKKIHWASYVILPLVFVHSILLGTTVRSSPVLRTYFIVLLALYGLIVVIKLIRIAVVRSRSYTVSHVVRENHDITSLYLEGPTVRHAPGQFMIVNLATEGLALAHPFTISSGPDDSYLRLSAKAVGDFTRRLPQVSVGSNVSVDAPYGVFSYTRVPGESLVFIAGGIGITPFLSQLRHLRATGDQSKVRLIWGNKTRADICFEEELKAAQNELADFSVVHVLSEDDAWTGERGFVTREIVEKYVDDTDAAEFFVCGPPIMMKIIVPLLRSLGVPRSRIHFERFAL
jgi:predicted ferric reductase